MTPEAWRERLSLSYLPSAYQAGLFDFVDVGKGNGMAVAVAGAGKSTSLTAAVKIALQRTRFVLALAFNREAKEQLEKKLEGTGARVKTVHGHGYAAIGFTFGWGNVNVEENKYRDLVDRYIAEFDAAQSLAGDDLQPAEVKAIADGGYPRAEILKLLELARLDLLDAFADGFGADLRRIAQHHNVEVDPALGQLVTDVVRLAMKWGANNPRIVDYTDMVWLPTVLRLRPWTADWVFVDEAQDISKAHRALIRASIKPWRGRALFVGDPKQAIYGFAGADADSFAAIIDEFECALLPLSVCYRCPTSVLDLAREIVPQIEAAPGAPEGIVRSSSTDAFIAEARRGDMVLCRLNAPLLSIAFKLIAAGVSACVRGRADVGKGLGKIIDRCSRGGWNGFGDALDGWEDKEQDSARKRYGKKSEDALLSRLEGIADQAECIRIIWGSSGAASANELKAAIDRLFADKDPKVVLSSIHRAKGLEAPRVFIAMPERLGQAWPNSLPWMVEQEENLRYVALTRAMSELVFLDCAIADLRDPGDGDGESGSDEGSEADGDGDGDGIAAIEKLEAWRRKIEQGGPAPLPPVDAYAPDTYDPRSHAARQALARRLDAALREAGFAARTDVGAAAGPLGQDVREVVYSRRRGSLTCFVYSTIEDGEARAVGKDSIKVALVRDSRGVGRAKRVNRVGKIEAIVGRVLARIEKLAPAQLKQAEARPPRQPEPRCPSREDHDQPEDHDLDGVAGIDSPALLPTSGSLRRAARTFHTGEDHMRPGETCWRDLADAEDSS